MKLTALNTENERLAFQFHEDTLTVSPPDSQEAMRHQAQLHFSIINLSGDPVSFSSGAEIELQINLGEGGGSMFTRRDFNGWGIINSPEGFTSTGWTQHPLKRNRLVNTLRPVTGSEFTLDGGLTLSFTWDRISSTAPEGYSSVSAVISGVTGSKSATLTDTVFKTLTNIHILQFSASPSTGAPGQEATLSWSIENAEQGRLMPGGLDVLGPMPQRRSSIKIPLDQDMDRYYLNLSGNGNSVFQDVNVFLAPPVIRTLYIDSQKQIVWKTNYSSRVILGQDSDLKAVTTSGSAKLNDGVSTVILSCEGLYPTVRKMAALSVPGIQSFYLDIQKYSSHKSVKLVWKTAGLDSLSLYAWDTSSYLLSSRPEGIWEQVFPLNTRLTYQLDYRVGGGESKIIKLQE